MGVAASIELSGASGTFRFETLAPGLVRCERGHFFKGERRVVTDVSGPCWMLVRAEARSGQVAFLCGETRVEVAGRRYALLLPPWSIVRSEFTDLEQQCEIVIASCAVPVRVRQATLFAPIEGAAPSTPQGFAALAAGAEAGALVGCCPRPSALGRRAKQAMDAGFRGAESIAAVAARLGVSHEGMTRAFSRDWGLTPSRYRAALRVLDAALLLLANRPVAETGFEVGFADLGRFYKQFRASTGTTPSRYRPRAR